MAAAARRARRQFHCLNSSGIEQQHHARRGYVLPIILLVVGVGYLWLGRRSLLPLLQTGAITSASLDLFQVRDMAHVVESSGSELVATIVDEDHSSLFYDDASITAIIPVSKDNVEGIHELLAPMFVEDTSLNAIILLSPPDLQPLLATVLNGIKSSFVNVEVTIWPAHLEETAALLDGIMLVESDYVLILDGSGFSGLGVETQDWLLVHPFFLSLPDGPCGGQKFINTTTCVIPSAEPQHASYLLPPFLAPTSLIKNFTTNSLHASSISWSSLGEWIAKDRGGVGGIVRGPGESSTDGCMNRCAKTNIPLSDEFTHLQHGIEEKPSGGLLHLAMDSQPNIVIVLPTIHDLELFSPAACKLSSVANGADTHILILSNGQSDNPAPSGTYPWLHDQLIYHGCKLSFSSLHSSTNEYANAEAASYWLSIAANSKSVIIFGDSGNTSRLFEAEVDKTRSTGTTLIKVPIDELPHAGWIGSLDALELKNWHAPKIEISIVTDDRPHSLTRLLKSLKNALYFGDTVNVRINMEQTSGRDTLRIVNEFTWPFGGLFVHHRIVHGGLLPAVTESWYPHSNDSYGIILEDDVEVSPLFYAWAKMALLRYRHGTSSNKSPTLFGISLYQQKNLELRLEGRRSFDARSLFDSHGFEHRNTPFLSQIPCSWGAVYFPEHWHEFHMYLSLRFSERTMPLSEIVVPHVRSNRWTRSWKKFFIELTYLRGYVMLYPNYDDFFSLSTNHLEVGSHVKQLPKEQYQQKKELFTLPLLQLANSSMSARTQPDGLLDLPKQRLPSWLELPILDLVGMLSSGRQLVRRGIQRQQELNGCLTMASDHTRRWSFEVRDLFKCKTEFANRKLN